MNVEHIILVVLVMTLVTFSTRAFPFVFAKLIKDNPAMSYLGLMLPPAIMLILVLYSLKDIDFAVTPHGMPEIIAVLSVVLIHKLWRSVFLSVGLGMLIYYGLSLIQ